MNVVLPQPEAVALFIVGAMAAAALWYARRYFFLFLLAWIALGVYAKSAPGDPVAGSLYNVVSVFVPAVIVVWAIFHFMLAPALGLSRRDAARRRNDRRRW